MASIIDKLKLAKYTYPVLLNCPPAQKALFESLQPATDLTTKPVDLIVAFVFNLAEMKQQILAVERQHSLTKSGYFYLAYPKIKSKRYAQGIGRDDIFPYLDVDESTGAVADTDLKFSRMVALDDDFTIIGLQSLSAAPRPTNGPSQRAADYEHRQADVVAFLKDHPIELAKYQALTPGYQREWARYLYGVKTAATQAKHAQEMLLILAAGYPSKTHYQKALREN